MDVISKTITEGIKRLSLGSEKVKEYELCLRLDKCAFIQTEISYQGYLIKKDKVRPSRAKIDAVSKFSMPQNSKQIQRFLGLTSYFRRFIPAYLTIARPL